MVNDTVEDEYKQWNEDHAKQVSFPTTALVNRSIGVFVQIIFQLDQSRESWMNEDLGNFISQDFGFILLMVNPSKSFIGFYHGHLS